RRDAHDMRHAHGAGIPTIHRHEHSATGNTLVVTLLPGSTPCGVAFPRALPAVQSRHDVTATAAGDRGRSVDRPPRAAAPAPIGNRSPAPRARERACCTCRPE